MAKKTMSIQIDESLQNAFKEKCKSKSLTYSEVAEVLLKAYVEDKLNVVVEKKYKITTNEK